MAGTCLKSEVFAKIWETDDLIVSMDAILAWKKWKGYDPLVNDAEFPDVPRKGKLHLEETKMIEQLTKGNQEPVNTTKEIWANLKRLATWKKYYGSAEDSPSPPPPDPAACWP